jgi:nucleotide-binding universal stress UspA family protein
MYKRILVATDGSPNAGHAVEHAIGLARLIEGAEVLIVYVCGICATDQSPDEDTVEVADSVVRDAAKTVTDAGVAVRTMVESDMPPESVGKAIADIARNEGADLIVLGSRGLSEFKGMLLGSVSSKVLHHAPCPVLVIKDQEAGD